MRRELERVELPDEQRARVRSWAVVREAFADRPPPRRTRSWRPLAALVAVAAVVAAVASPPGRSVVDSLREAIGLESAEPALFSLPAAGKLLVTADSGTWVVEHDGSTRRLGRDAEAAWSPFGRYVVAARANELVALEPDGGVRWTLARPDVRLPRWGGTRTDTRIAYLSGTELRVVAGDGTGDRVLDPDVRPSAPVWRPGAGHVLVYTRRDGTLRAVNADTGEVLDAQVTGSRPRESDKAAVRRLLGDGDFAAPVRSPDGRWLAVGWPEADQLVFVRARGPGQIRAVSNVGVQFRSRSFPRIEGWCCSP